MKLYTKILLALVAGAAIGIIAKAFDIVWLRDTVIALEPIGTAFIRLMTMIVLPLVVSSLLVGTASLGDAQRVGKVGGRTLAFSVIMTIVAACVGLAAFHLIRPGSGLDPVVRDQLAAKFTNQAQSAARVQTPLVQTVLEIIPRNPFKALTDLDLLAVVFFTIIFGAATGVLRESRKRPILAFFDATNDVSMVMIGWVMKLAPYGVFALSGAVFANFVIELLGSLFLFCVTVALGEVIYGFGVLGAVVRVFVAMNPVTFFRKIAKAPLVAFSTSSSNAALPVSIDVAETELGISKKIAGFVLPLSATLNKTGSALYKAVAVMFIAQVYGVHLGLTDEIVIVLAATASAISGAGVPGSGMVTILIVLNAVGMTAQAQAGVALVVGVDRLLDMIRTTVNVMGQVVGVAYVARADGEVLNVAMDQRTLRATTIDHEVAGVAAPATSLTGAPDRDAETAKR
jgi:Na+/H+-dicarboxylate symporter